jgi:pyruvate kinase
MRTIGAQQAPLQAHELFSQVNALYERVGTAGRNQYEGWAPKIARRSFLPSALNLAQYLAFREGDLRDLQGGLVPLGLSSLGRCEAHVLPSIRAVRATLGMLCGAVDAAEDRPTARDFALGARLLERNTRAVFGADRQHKPGIMVTLGAEAAEDPLFVERLISAGMDCARINCAHDDAGVWERIAHHVRSVSETLERRCSIYMDVAGPKIRTGELTHDPARRFHPGDRLRLTSSIGPDEELPQVVCTEPAVFRALRPGAMVWINDGKLGATVIAGTPKDALIEITHAGPKGGKIASDKGLNFPETTVEVPALTKKDRADLDEIAALADIVGQSFVRNAADVGLLQEELRARGALLPIVAKIETATAIRNLPEILVSGGGQGPFGVMIARGDLAVEIGYLRLAEIQEELLWLCEAAHVPVIWATQVLDQVVRKGTPSRSEMTDAAMAERAECVMLNKGPFVVEATVMLADVLSRMRGHQAKKSPQLRALHSWSEN